VIADAVAVIAVVAVVLGAAAVVAVVSPAWGAAALTLSPLVAVVSVVFVADAFEARARR